MSFLILKFYVQDCVSDIMKHARQSNVPMVIDGVCTFRDEFILFQLMQLSSSAAHIETWPFVWFFQDGLFLVTNCLDLVKDYPLAVLTPNINEYKRLVQKVLNCEVNGEKGAEQLLSLAKGYVRNLIYFSFSSLV